MDRDVAHQQSPCPFLHYVERRRDKVIQDDVEFKDYLAQQDRIVEDFMEVLELKTVAHKNDYYNGGFLAQPGDKEVVSRMGLPCPGFVLGVTYKNIIKSAKACQKIEKVKEVLYLKGNDLDTRKTCQQVPKSVKVEKIVSFPAVEPVFV